MTRVTRRVAPAVLAIVVLLVGCAQNPSAGNSPETPAAGVAVAAGETVTITPITVSTATSIAPPPVVASATPTPETELEDTPTLAPTATGTATATATPRHPLDIEAMRQRTFGESGLTLEATLTWGPGYERFIYSYLSDGHKIYAYMTVPREERPPQGWPVIIFNHGYIPPEVYRSTERYEYYVEGFAQNGYIVFRSDYRGHGNSEGEPEGAYSSPAYTVDVLNGLEAVKTHPDIDPNRIGMWGHSMGGYITLRSMVINPEIKAGVIWAGVVGSYPDLLEHWRRSGPTRTPDPSSTRRSWRRDLMEEYGSPQDNPAFWAAISANSYLSELSAPLQLHHGTADTSVPHILSELLAEEVEAVGKSVETYLYEGDDHNLTINFSTAMERSVAFFDQYVKGSE